MRQLINIHVAILVVLSAVLFGRGQYSLLAQATAPLIALVAAALAHVYTDRRQRFELGHMAVNGAIFVIAMVTGWLLVRAHAVSQAVAIGQGLIALQVVLLFEAKTGRSRWDLISLSLLTVFVSTSFIHGPSFGLILVIYFYVAFSTFALLLFERERQACNTACSHVGVVVTAATATKTNWWRLVAVAFTTLAVGPFALFLRFPDLSRRKKIERTRDEETRAVRWPLLGRKPVINLLGRDMPVSAFIGREFRWRMGWITGVSIVLSLIFFCAAPRFGRFELELPQLSEVPWKQRLENRRRAVGYSDRVSLGEMGTISENQMMVLTIQFTDDNTGVPFKAVDGAYLRGTVLTQYLDGQWSLARYAPPLPLQYTATDPLVRQKIAVQDLDDQDLFCVWPFVKIRDDPSVRFESRSERLHRSRDAANVAFTYELGTTAFDNRVQTDLVPCTRVLDRQTLLEWPDKDLPSLARQAGEWIDGAGASGDGFIERARILQQRLQASERFEYSLDEPSRNASVDPIEDFVTEHPQGNCEFFASALALMLRSQGIPSRLVVGYRASVFKLSMQSYAVRQCDAHAWVEAYIPPEQLAGRQLPNNHSDWSRGAWLRLEPTPGSAIEMTGMALLAQQMRNAVNWVRTVWRDRIMGMSGSQQRAAIYGPLLDTLKRWRSQLSSPERWAGWRGRKFWVVNKSVLGLVWLSCVALGLSFIFVRFRLRSFSSRGRRGRTGRPAAGRDSAAVAFYEQLETLLAGYGRPRRSSQTQREFARCAGEQIAALSGEQAVVAWTQEVVDAYYRVRFGNCDLDGGQAATIASLLAKIRAVVGASSKRVRPPIQAQQPRNLDDRRKSGPEPESAPVN